LQQALLFFSLFISASPALSLVTVKNISGVSYYDSTAQKIYAGFAGTCASPDSGSTCNTCTDTSGTGLKPCNLKAVHSTLSVSFSFTSTADLSTKSVALYVGNDSSNSQVATATGVAANVDMTLSATWADFCSGATDLNSDCSVSSSADQTVSTDRSFYLGSDDDGNGSISSTEKIQVPVHFHAISDTVTTLHTQPYCAGDSSSGYGLCFYSLATGDEKLVILGDPQPLSNSTPPSGSPAFQSVAFFAFPQAAGISASISNGQVQPVIIPFVSTTDLSISGDPYITGLANYERYCVFAGQVNLAQNIFAFTTTGLDDTQMCKETSEVVGLLDDKHCFISTAAFGYDMASEVQIFRNFRNTFLLHNKYGAEFVKAYYQWGPQAAELISGSEVLRSITRGVLYPALGFSWVALNYGFWSASLVLLMSMVFCFQLAQKLRQILSSRMAREFSKK